MPKLLKNEWISFVGAILVSILIFMHVIAVLTFLISAVALAARTSVVGQATEQLGNYLGPGATGVLQSAISNLPELFVSFLALQAGF